MEVKSLGLKMKWVASWKHAVKRMVNAQYIPQQGAVTKHLDYAIEDRSIPTLALTTTEFKNPYQFQLYLANV